MASSIKHIAVIMDGNGRWAKAQGLPRIFGHRTGTKATVATVEAGCDLGLQHLTLFVFSSENWQRPSREVDYLMGLLAEMVDQELPHLQERNVRMDVLGELSKVPVKSRRKLEEAISVTSSNTGMQLHLAISYGGRQEIVDAARAIAHKVQAGELQPDQIDQELFSRHLYLPNLPDPELVIRTGGEQRISNYLLWQAAYSELYITEVLWPDFTRIHLDEALKFFATRKRRFGKVSDGDE